MLRTLAVAALLTAPVGAQQTAQSIMATAGQKEAARLAGVSDYVIIQSTGVMEAPAYYEKTEIGGKKLFRLVPMVEWEKRRPGAIQNPEAMAAGMAMALDYLKGEMQTQMGGTPAGAALGGEMAGMMDNMVKFSMAAATASDHISDGRAEAKEAAQGQALFATRARFVGRERVDTFETLHLHADNLQDIPLQQPEDGGKVTMLDASLWLDATDYVPRRLLMHLDVENDGRHVPIALETVLGEYQRKGTLLVAGHQAMQLRGIMEAMATDSKDRKKLEKARKDLEKMQAQMAGMDEQMAKMPAGARRMMQGQIDKAMKQMEMLAADGSFNAELSFRIHSVNQGPPFDWVPKPGQGN